MSAATLKITDGTTNIDFTGSYYKILTAGGWAPRRAGRRQSQLAGMSPYEDVLETMYIRIVGTSVAACLGALEDLSELLDQAERWGRGENVTPVEIQYKPLGSASASAVTANIIGPPEGGDFLTLPSDFDAIDDRNYALGTHANPIILQFVRRGLWLGDTETDTSGASSGNPEIQNTTSFTNASAVHVPYNFRAYINRAALTEAYDVWTLIQNETSKIKLIEVEDMTLSASGTSTPTFQDTVVAAASGGYVGTMDFNHGDNTGNAISSGLSAKSGSPTWAWWIVADNRSGADINIQVSTYNKAANISYGPTVIIPAGDTAPTVYFLGVTTTRPEPAIVQFDLSMTDGSSTGEIDFDYMFGICMDDNAHVIHTPAVFEQDTDTYLHFNHNLDGGLYPTVYETDDGTTSIREYPSYDGNAGIYMSDEGSRWVLIVGVDGKGDWRIDDGSGSEATITIQMVMTEGYLTPV